MFSIDLSLLYFHFPLQIDQVKRWKSMVRIRKIHMAKAYAFLFSWDAIPVMYYIKQAFITVSKFLTMDCDGATFYIDKYTLQIFGETQDRLQDPHRRVHCLLICFRFSIFLLTNSFSLHSPNPRPRPWPLPTSEPMDWENLMNNYKWLNLDSGKVHNIQKIRFI